MKIKMIAAAIALAGASLCLAAPASAQIHDNSRSGVARDNGARDNGNMGRGEMRRDDRRGHNDRRWNKRQHCRTEWRHHRKVRICR